jgi:hypothetical protein
MMSTRISRVHTHTTKHNIVYMVPCSEVNYNTATATSAIFIRFHMLAVYQPGISVISASASTTTYVLVHCWSN